MGHPARVPIDMWELSNAQRPFGYSRTLPAVAYTYAEVLAWEQRKLFARLSNVDCPHRTAGRARSRPAKTRCTNGSA